MDSELLGTLEDAIDAETVAKLRDFLQKHARLRISGLCFAASLAIVVASRPWSRKTWEGS